MDEQLEFVRLIARRLDEAGIPYMITGSLAQAAYAAPRMTRDIDLVVNVSPRDAGRLAGLFASDCYVDEDAVREAVSRQSMFNVIHNEWVIKADFIVRKDEPYRVAEFERRRQVDVGGASVWVVAPEDLILSKLVWSRESESAMQQRDVEQLVGTVPGLDWQYLEKWASQLGVDAALASVKDNE